MIKGSEVREQTIRSTIYFWIVGRHGQCPVNRCARRPDDPLRGRALGGSSSYNNQPWRILYARRETEQWQLFFDLLVPANQVWVKEAGALLVFISKETFDFNGKPSVTHSFDTGAAWENLALQGWLTGLVVHGMQGFDYERARTALQIPEGFRVEAMVAVGHPGNPTSLPADAQKRELPSDRRKLEQTICEGPFCFQ